LQEWIENFTGQPWKAFVQVLAKMRRVLMTSCVGVNPDKACAMIFAKGLLARLQSTHPTVDTHTDIRIDDIERMRMHAHTHTRVNNQLMQKKTNGCPFKKHAQLSHAKHTLEASLRW
jgi:hypothetical protein